MISDLLLTNPTNRAFGSLLQINDTNNVSFGGLFACWAGDGTSSIGAFICETLELYWTNKWHRVAFAVDMANRPEVISKYIDGIKLGEESVRDFSNHAYRDAEFSLQPIALLLTGADNYTFSGLVNSVQIRNYTMPDSEIAALGGPGASGIPWLRFTSATRQPNGNVMLVIETLTASGLTQAPQGLEVFATTNLTLNLSDWVRVPSALTLAVNGTLQVEDPDSADLQQRFYVLIKGR